MAKSGRQELVGSCKRCHQHLDQFINSIPLHVSALILVLADCFIVVSELLFSYNMIMNVQADDKTMVLLALSSTSLAIVSLFLLEVVVRIFSMGAHFRRRKMEIFDVVVVVVTFVADLVFFVIHLQDEGTNTFPFARAFSFLVALRLWRCWGILRGEKKRVREETACELDMERYARRQAEAQADVLQAQCDQQLKEIAYLRDFLHQNNLYPDTTKLDFVPNYRTSASISSSAIDYEKADTLRVNGKLSKDASLDSIASSAKELATSLSSSQNIYSEPPTLSSGPLSSSPAPSVSSHHRDEGPTSEDFASRTSREIVQEAVAEVQQKMSPSKRGGLSNAGFTPDEEGQSSNAGVAERRGVDGEENRGTTNLAFEGDTPEPCSPANSEKTDSEGESEAQLRIELDEIRRLSEEALRNELASSNTTEVDGIPTTSL
ncbi:uncharacterized protein LOC110984124 isoform X2 [Acanthaster planci]|uniref:Voltage-gated hydrogen channel 1 n=1 Tax=Acanthaster planci TaxID=133434 RepID=A0A8B7Z8P9_ACAPL|nr:uncharacterized protein LOC110984124 isoform X2 [Acanthaster planci]